jgi:hypothetical protein
MAGLLGGQFAHRKGGGKGRPSVNDALNAIINLGGMAAPMGAGTGAGAMKGLVQQLEGTRYNRNHLNTGNDAIYGPSFGERAVTGIGEALHDLTHSRNLSVPPNSQMMHSQRQDGFPPPMPLSDFMVRPRAKPIPMPLPPIQQQRPALSNEEILRRLRQQQEYLWRNQPAAPTS